MTERSHARRRGDRREDFGHETFKMLSPEIDQLARVLDAVEDNCDVEDLADALLADDTDDT
jgi:hypothetical protein